jgi:2-polyprenyl-6-methoxyphenol hydroxylase-like FAD-dependent oxidoreductase
MKKPYADKRAFVIGAGIGGLAAAAALAPHFGQVVVLERDPLPDGARARAGIAQDRLPHALLAGGCAALAALFPDLAGHLSQAGAHTSDAGRDGLIELPGGVALPRRELGIHTYLQSRPLLEAVLRGQLRQLHNVVLRDANRVLEIVGGPAGQVAGVCVETREGKRDVLTGCLVVDASGRGAPTLDFLRALGRPLPEETALRVDLTYGSALYSFAPGVEPDFKVAITHANAPHGTRGGMLLMREHGLWDMLLASRSDDLPPLDEAAFLDWTRSLNTPTLFDALRRGRRESKVTRFGFSESRRRHFAQLRDFPGGLLPLGDAICQLNPLYGQGMTVAAQQALLLHSLLAGPTGADGSLTELGMTYLAASDELIDTPWTLSEAADLVYPQTRGPRPPELPQRLAWHASLNGLAMLDPVVQKLLAEVRHLLKPDSALHTPELKRRVHEMQRQPARQARQAQPAQHVQSPVQRLAS